MARSIHALEMVRCALILVKNMKTNNERKILSILDLFVVITLLWITTGCGPRSNDVTFVQQVESTKQHNKASEIKRIAIQYCSKYKTNGYTSFGLVPKEIASLPLFSEYQPKSVMPSVYPDADIIEFEVGGGFTHQGIFICPTNSDAGQKFLKQFQGTMLPWEGGVYFWADWHVRGVPKQYWNERD